jgi:hypothetical protein
MNNEFKYDILRMYYGEDYWVTNEIVIHQPTLQQIMDYGESEFWVMVSMLCANPTSMRLELWNKGIDWNTLSDFDLFIMLAGGLPKDTTEILFGDFDLTKLKETRRQISEDEEQKILVYMPNPIIQIDESIYNRMVGYLRTMFDIHPKVEKAKGKATKEAIIDEERMNLRIAEKKQKTNKWKKSTLFPLISAAINHPGFKYKKNELREVGIVEFMDSVKRLQIYESTTALMTGMYMGMVDLKGMDLKKELNWTRDLYED